MIVIVEMTAVAMLVEAATGSGLGGRTSGVSVMAGVKTAVVVVTSVLVVKGLKESFHH